MLTDSDAIANVPPGRWAVGVSGGADSTALARLATAAGRAVVLVHLDHHLRGDESDADAAFVADLGRQLGVAADIARRDAIDRMMLRRPANAQAAYRAARLVWFATVVRRRNLDGVLLAHHADDQAETVLLRLLRGSGAAALGGMKVEQHFRAVDRMFGVEPEVGPDAASRPWPLRVVRPLLAVCRAALRDYLVSIGQFWREDASNDSPKYRRNVIRRVLADRPDLTPVLLDLMARSGRLRSALAAAAPTLDRAFPADALRLPLPIAERAALRWLVARGAPPDRVPPAVCHRLVRQATDVARPARQHYPGGLLVRRRQKRVDVIPSPPVQSPRTHGQKTAPTPEL